MLVSAGILCYHKADLIFNESEPLIMYRFSVFRVLCLVLTLCLVLAAGAPAVFAAEAPELFLSPQTEEAARGKKYRLALQFQSDAETQISAFRMKLTYDPSYLTLTDVEGPIGTGAADFRSSTGNGEAIAVFASEEHPVSLADGVCCTLVFTVAEDAPVGSASVTAVLDQLVDNSLQSVEGTISAAASVPMAKLLSGEAMLRSLVPSAGSLTPSFSPEITEYTMTVPYAIKQLTFTAAAADGASYRVNRKNLGAGGTSTTFIVKVTSKNKQAATEYVITVTREPKPAGAADRDPDTEEPFTAPAEQAQTAKSDGGTMVFYGNRTIHYGNSQFAVFVLGIAAAGICVLIILLICAKKKNKRRSGDDYRPKH